MSLILDGHEQAVESALKDLNHIGTLPEVTLKIIELVEDPDSTAAQLHELISTDPALCGRVLKVVNSSFYGLPGQVASIDRAIVMLGLNAVKNIAIAASLNKLFRGGTLTQEFSARDLWDHSIATAVCSKLLADAIGHRMGDEAFLAGLMHDVGIMVELQTGRHELVDVLESITPANDGVPAGSMLEAERRIFGADHTSFGAGLCAKWKFPRTLAAVCAFHHRPTEAPEEQRLAVCLVAVAERLAAQVCGSFRLDLMSLEIPADVLETAGLTEEVLDDVRKSLPESLETAQAMLA
ncbi:MAG: HDOD domain-containing protein [Planctomycetota bacterium]